jgi:hypothetical protein
VDLLVTFFRKGRAKSGTFDAGIETAVRMILVSPDFLFRVERDPANVAPGAAYKISGVELASRLSFFLWSSIPDDELLDLGVRGALTDPAVLEQQVRRMLKDDRAAALVSNFAGQWLLVRNLKLMTPNTDLFPQFDESLREAFQRETELFFESIVREDRSIKDLLTADYTFVDERLAKHYGIPNVYGSQFQRVTLGPDLDVRRGLLGKGALLTITSQPTRTSPVARGQYFLQTFLGVTPPQPPLDVPVIPPRKDDATGNSKEPSMRQRMEQHRADPGCAACHKIMDPIGFSLENFDAVGFWRTTDEGVPIDAAGELVDGTALNGPTSLRDALLRYSDQYVRVVTEKLLTYALGRGTEDADMPIVRSIVRDAARDNYRISSIVLGIVKSAPFQMSVKSQADDDRPAAR